MIQRTGRSLLLAVFATLLSVSCVSQQSRAQAVSWTELGNAWAELERWDKAGEAWSRAMGLDPGQLVASYNLARALAEAGKYDESIAKSDEFLAFDPENAAVMAVKAYALHKAGRDEEALAVYQKVERLNGGDLASVYNLALLMEALGRIDDAMQRYEQILLIQADHVGASYRKGLILSSQGESDSALPLLLRYVEANPKSKEARSALALAQERAGRYQEALGSYRTMLENDDKDADAWFAMARLNLTVIEDGQAGLDALGSAITNGFKDRDRVRALLDDPKLVVPEAVKEALDKAGLLTEPAQQPPADPQAPSP